MIQTIVVTTVVIGGLYLSAKGGLSLLRNFFKSEIDRLNRERTAIEAQKDYIANALLEMAKLSTATAAEATKAKKGLFLTREIVSRIHDEAWMSEFEKGRINAPYN